MVHYKTNIFVKENKESYEILENVSFVQNGILKIN
jgi:hypothetical protein